MYNSKKIFVRYCNNMRYKDIECTVCGKKFDENSDVVVCPVCGAPCHRECWQSVGHCIHESEHDSGYRWEFPVREPAGEEQPEAQPNNPDNPFGGIKFDNGEKIVICPNCGTANYENDMYCSRCHAPLKNSDNGFANGRPQTDEEHKKYVDDIINNFNEYGGLKPDTEVDGVPVREMAAYIGGKAPGKFIRRFSTMERYNKSVYPTIGAVLGPIWFFRHKMTKIGAIISAVMLLLATAAGIVGMTTPYKEMAKATGELMSEAAQGTLSSSDLQSAIYSIQEAYVNAEYTTEDITRTKIANVLYYLFIYGVPMTSFIVGMSAYRKKINTDIMKIRGECTTMEEYMNTLRLKGGTSAGFTVLGVLVWLLAMFLYLYLPIMLVIF